MSGSNEDVERIKEIVLNSIYEHEHGDVVAYMDFDKVASRAAEGLAKHFISRTKLKAAVVEEMNVATGEGQPTSRLTSLLQRLK